MSRPLRVLHVIRSDGFAGVEGHVARLARTQDSQGLDVRVIGGDGRAMGRELAGTTVGWRPAVTVLDAWRAINDWHGHDILHAHMTAAELAATASVRTRSPLVATRHFASPRGASLAGKLAAPLIRRRVAVQIAISDYVAERVDGPSVVIHPGVPDRADATRPRERIVLVAQRLEPEKATEVAVRAFAASGLVASGWLLVVAGDGSQRVRLEGLAAELKASGQVHFLGRRSDLGELMTRAGLLLAPCEVEGFGLTVVEAMAAGLPVVAAGGGAHLETVGGVPDAALFEPGDALAAGRQLRRLADDRGLRESYGAELRARQRAVFTLDAQARATEEVYRGVL